MAESTIPKPYSDLIDWLMEIDKKTLEDHSWGFVRPYFVGELYPLFPEDCNAIRVDPVEDGVRIRTPLTEDGFKPTYKPIDYKWYIQSFIWKAKAHRAKELAGFKCQLCNANQELHAHHRTYDQLGFEKIEDITVLCADCHAKFHNKIR